MANKEIQSGQQSGGADAPPDIEAELPLPEPTPQKSGTSRSRRFLTWYGGHKKWSIPLSVLALLLALLAIPPSRYALAGLAIKKNFTIEIKDATTLAPVSGATVSSGTASAQTDGSGKANLRLRVGHHSLTISKKYYQDSRAEVLVPIILKKPVAPVKFQATGRQVKISVKNAVSKKDLANADIKILDISAKTDKDGKALVVLPAGAASQKATLSLAGFNTAEVTIKVSDSVIAENNLTLTPAGKVYFLSKQTGKIDLVKSNLDGAERETVLAGTGKEDNQNTVLLASRDWKYLALLSRRDSDLAKLYLIETGSDKVTAIDEGNATFDLIGWSDAHFVYRVNRRGYQPWQPKQSALKSYDAVAKRITLLDETDASGTGAQDSGGIDASYENFSSIFIIGQRVMYTKSWYTVHADSSKLEDKSLGIYSINVTGSGGRSTHKSFGYMFDKSTYEQSYLNKPDQVYFQIVEKDAEAKYYVYANNQASEKSSIKDQFSDYLNGGQYNTYLQSPSGNVTFWNESRDGKNTLFVGDGQGANQKEIAKLSDYQTYGWYTEDYLLVSKDDSELYIFGKDGIKKDSEALKITDYHKPAVSYMGYGGM
ncbi:hypothetical protein HYS84_03875 [Candidatus Saccharibacteria bacterium]|nr:hypothetical protein [Candidatus Saccharibacteria bacterium]